MSDHSLLSASSAERWSRCPISVTGQDTDRSSEAAAEGTALHGVAETVLRSGKWPEIGTMLSADGFEFEFTEDRYADVKVYTDYVMGLPWISGYTVEGRVSYGQALGTPHNLSFGTSDCYGFTETADGRVLRVIDLKMGRKAVNPERNPQAALYAAGVLESLSPLLLPRNHQVELTIIQPRISRRPATWMTDVAWVEDTVLSMRPAAGAVVRYKNGTQTEQDLQLFPELPGTHCQYCRRKTSCSAFKREMDAISQPGKIVKWNPTAFAMRESIRGYLDDLEQLALDEAMRGNTLPGSKLVLGRAGRAELLASKEQVLEKAKLLGVDKSIAKVETVWATPSKMRDALRRGGMSAEELSTLIVQPPAKPQIADASDPRSAYDPVDTSGFKGVAI